MVDYLGKRVNTKFGKGTVLRREGEEGIKSTRYVVKLDEPKNWVFGDEEKYGKQYPCFFTRELEFLEEEARLDEITRNIKNEEIIRRIMS